MKVEKKKFLPLPELGIEVRINKSLPDLSQHPAVLRKVARAREILEKSPIPEHLLRSK